MDITSAPPRPTAGPGREPPEPTTPPAAGDLPRWRVHALRVVYLYLVVGQALTRWPDFVRRDEPLPLMDGVVDAMIVTLSVLFLVGIRYPVRMLPVLVFESAWKLLWLATVALPLWTTDRLTPAFGEVAFSLLWVAPVLLVVPWGHVVRQYVRARAERWR